MKKRSLRKRISYWVDRMMSKGPIAMSVVLFVITTAVVGIIGIIAYFVDDSDGILYQIWSSLMYTLDAGNLADVPTDNIIYLMLMFLATLCGLFLTSVLIGVIATGVESKLSSLRKGTSTVQEDNHTVIIGFDNGIFSILRELIEANSNKKRECIVVLGEQPKEKMEEAIASHISDFKTTKIICRSGNLHEGYIFERCSVETCKSVIINIHEDAEIVKIILALSSYVKEKKLRNEDLKFVASFQNNQYSDAAKIAGEGHAAFIGEKDAIARIISNTCRQHGLSLILTELFNFGGDEIYFEKVPELEGKTFKDAILSFSNAVAIGLYLDGQVQLNPPMDTVISKDNFIALLEEDDGSYSYHSKKEVDCSNIITVGHTVAKANDNLLVLGSNEKLTIILKEYAKYVDKGARVVLVDDDLGEFQLETYENLEVTVCAEHVTRELLCRFLNDNMNNILLLNDDSLDVESSDSQTLLRLILLRDIADKNKLQLSITTEMRSVDNQRLATQARVDDFVVGTDITSLLLAQISENPHILPLIEELLDESGSELYMKPIADYVTIGVPVDSYALSESAARKGEVYIGYRRFNGTTANIVVNPKKDEEIIFGEQDQIVVIAED